MITLSVNGRARTVAAETEHTLLEVLREQLLLTGAKRGCNQGVCGACTVLVDGRPVRSCLSLAVALEGSEIVTVEGLAPPDALTPVQHALVDNNAVQCGFCTSGVVVAATALLRENAAPTVDEVRVALSGNLCRCSGYEKIIEAVCRAGGTVEKAA
jgi:aerobic carbon-monoxide dehydrogenase small subunit